MTLLPHSLCHHEGDNLSDQEALEIRYMLCSHCEWIKTVFSGAFKDFKEIIGNKIIF